MSQVRVPGPVQVRLEIWSSLVSMLRVYSTAAGLNHGEFTVETRSRAACVRHKGNAVEICFSPLDGLAGWTLTRSGSRKRTGSFTILGDGALDFDGTEKPLDEAALDWIDGLIQTPGSADERRDAMTMQCETVEEKRERKNDPGLGEQQA